MLRNANQCQNLQKQSKVTPFMISGRREESRRHKMFLGLKVNPRRDSFASKAVFAMVSFALASSSKMATTVPLFRNGSRPLDSIPKSMWKGHIWTQVDNRELNSNSIQIQFELNWIQTEFELDLNWACCCGVDFNLGLSSSLNWACSCQIELRLKLDQI